MSFKRYNGSEISPCILSHVKFALGLKKTKPINNKKCSALYWNEIVEIITEHNSITKKKYKLILK